MEGLGFAILAFGAMGVFFYKMWRDKKRWNNGVCALTGVKWEWDGFISPMGMYAYRGGIYKGRTQFIWLSELIKPEPPSYHGGKGTTC